MRIDFVPGVSPQPVQTPGTTAPRVQPTGDNGEQDAIMRGAAIGLRLGEQWQDNIDRAALTEADNRMAESVRETMQDPEKGYLSTVGKNAVGDSRRRAEGTLKERREAIEAGLSTNQREQFAEIANRRQQRALAAMDEHEQHQGRVWAMGETEARAKSIGQDAVSAWGTPEFPVMHGSMLTAIDDYADLAGLGDEGKKALRSAATTELHGSIVERLVGRGMTKEAQAHLAQYEGEIAPDRADGLRGVLAHAADQDVGKSVAMEARKLGTVQERLELVDGLWKAGKLTTKQSDDATQRIQQEDARDAALQAREANLALRDAQNWRQLNPGGAANPNLVGPPGPGDLMPLPPAMVARLEASGALDDFNVWVQNGGEWTTKPAGQRALMWGDDVVSSFKSDDDLIQSLRTVLSDDDLGRMVKRRQELAQPPKMDGSMSETDRSRIVLKGAWDYSIIPDGMQGAKLTDADAGRLLRWQVAVDQGVQALTEGKRKAQPADYKKVMETLSGDLFDVGGVGVPASVATPAQVAEGTWQTPYGPIDAKAVEAVREAALGDLAQAGRTERDVTEARIAAQAKWILDERARAAEGARGQTQALRTTGERTLAQLYRAALSDPVNKGSRSMAADKVAAVMGDNLGAMGMDADSVRAFLAGMSGDGAKVDGQNAMDPDLAWKAEVRRRNDLQGSWRNLLVSEGRQRWYFLGSENARQENARKEPNNPQFFYENWHRIEPPTGRIKSYTEAARENPYLDPNYRGGDTARQVEKIVNEAAR